MHLPAADGTLMLPLLLNAEVTGLRFVNFELSTEDCRE